VTTSGTFAEFWFTEGIASVGRITPAGVITEFPVAQPGAGITVGANGNLWFVTGGLATMTTSGLSAEGPLPGNCGTEGLTSAPDGYLWILCGTPAIGRFTP
jgi:streptogramin lyase